MKKYRIFAVVIAIALLAVGCNKPNTNNTASTPKPAKKYTVFVDSAVPSGELEDSGYINATGSADYVDASEYLDFNLKVSFGGIDSDVTELTKNFNFNGNSYDCTYTESTIYKPLSSNIKAFENDTAYDNYVFNKGKNDEVSVTYNRNSGSVHKIVFIEKNLEPNESFTHEMAVAAAEKLADEFLGENNSRIFEFSKVQDVKQKTGFIEVRYVRTIFGYKTEQTLLVRFNYDGSLKSIGYGKLGFFSNSECQISALDYYEGLLSEDLILKAENELKKAIPRDDIDKSSMIIGFDSNGNCLLHMAYLYGNSTLVKYYVNLFELVE